MLYRYAPEDGRKAKVSACVMHTRKIFLSMIGGCVQSRGLDDFQLIKTLHEGSMVYNDQEPVLLTTPLAIHGDILVVPISSEDKIYLWNARIDELFCTVALPTQRSSKIYDVRINATHIVCLASWSLIAWSYKIDENGIVLKINLGPMIAYDYFSQSDNSNQVNIWFETHNLEMNESYVVTHASQPLIAAVPFNLNTNGQKTRSFMHCRKMSKDSILGPIIKLSENLVFGMEIGSIRLSSNKYNVLALMYIDENMSPMCYAVKLMRVPSGDIISNVFQTRLLHSEVRMPISWVDNKLFMLLVPKFSVSMDSSTDSYDEKDQNDHDVTLSLWNYETNSESFLKHVDVMSMRDTILVDHTKVVQLFHRLTKEPDQNLCHEIRGRIYDYWNN